MKKIYRPSNHVPLDVAAIIAKRYRVSASHARVIVELAGIGAKHLDIDIVGGGATR